MKISRGEEQRYSRGALEQWSVQKVLRGADLAICVLLVAITQSV